MYTVEQHQRHAPVAWLKPISRNAGTVFSDIVDMRLINRLTADILVGAITGAATLVASIVANEANQTSGGTTVTGKTLSAGTFSGSDDSDGIARIEVTAEEIAALGNNFRYAYLSVTSATAAVVFAAVLYASDARYGDAEGTIPDLAAVREIIY